MRRGIPGPVDVVALLGAVALVGAVALAGGCATHRSSARSASATTTAAARSASRVDCTTPARIGPLPAWAQAGFYPPTAPRPYVMGQQGNIIAILWASQDPLHVPPPKTGSNKILWVSRLDANPASPLQIRATLAGTPRVVTQEIAGGPGPSYVNLPATGCWNLDLTWSGHHDRVGLRYVALPQAAISTNPPT